MKTSRTLKRPILLVIAAVLAIAVIASLAVTYALANDTPTAVLSQYQVTMNGRLNLRFIYSEVGEKTTGFTAQVGDNTYNYTLDQVKNVTETESGDVTTYVVSVPLEHSKMASDVSVWPVDENGATGTVETYSVKDYAMNVLGDNELSSYHDTMRALLNWGNYSNVMFGNGEGKIDNVFARGTNPASAVNSIAWGKKEAMEIKGTTFPDTDDDHSTVTLAFVNGDVALNFYIAYKGDSALSAHISRGEVVVNDKKTIPALDKDLTVVDTGEKTKGDTPIYLVSVKNLSIELFNTFYTLEVKGNEGESLKVHVSVLEYLNNILTLKKEDGNTSYFTEKEKNVARSLYQFYQLGANKKPTTCEHIDASSNMNTYWVKKDSAAYSFKCSYCYGTLNTINSDVIDRYISTDLLAKNDATYDTTESKLTAGTHYQLGEEKFSYDKDNKMSYLRLINDGENKVSQYIWCRATADNDSTAAHEHYTIDVGQAKYFVVKMRSNTTDVTHVKVSLHLSTVVVDGKKSVDIPVEEAQTSGSWTTYVIDLEKVFDEYYEKGEGANYILDTFYLHIEPINDDKYIDLSYIAFVDTWADVAALGADEKFYEVTANGVGHSVKLSAENTPICISHDATETVTNDADGNQVYTYTCRSCNATLSKTVGKNVNFYSGVEAFAKFYGNSGSLSNIKFDGDVAYRTFYSETNDHWNLTGGEGSGKPTEDKYPIGDYLVIKYRLNGEMNATGSLALYVGAYVQTGTDTESNPTCDVVQSKIDGRENNTLPKDWTVAVIDIRALKESYEYKEETAPFYMMINPKGKCAMDIAYVATVDGIEELELVADDFMYLDHGADFTTDGELKAVLSEVPVYITPEMMLNPVKAAWTTDDTTDASTTISTFGKLSATTQHNMVNIAVKSDGGLSYYTFTKGTVHDTISQFIWNRDAASWSKDDTGASWPSEKYSFNVGNANYLVVKMRLSDAEQTAPLYLSTVGTATNENASIKNGTGKNKDNARGDANYGDKRGECFIPVSEVAVGEWGTYVIDLEKVYGDAYNPSAGQTETYDIDTFFFGFTNKAADKPIDIAYIAFVEGDWSNIKSVVEDQQVTYVSVSGEGALVNTSDGKCVGECNRIYTLDTSKEKGYTYRCVGCGSENDDINLYIDQTGGFYNNGDHSVTTGLVDDEGVTYTNITTVKGTHIDLLTSNPGGGDGSFVTTTHKAGRYWAIKIRGTLSGDWTLSLASYDKNSNDSSLYKNGMWESGNIKKYTAIGNLKPSYLSTTDWRVLVIEIPETLENYTVGTIARLGMRNGAVTANIDVAYVAMADTLADLKTVIEDDTYYFFKGSFSNGYAYLNKSDDKCVSNHVNADCGNTECDICGEYAPAAPHAVVETVTGTIGNSLKLSYSCKNCSATLAEKNVPNTINYYVKLDKGSAQFQAPHTLEYDSVEKIPYLKFTNSKVNGSFIIPTNTTSGDNGHGSCTTTTHTPGRYIVFKYRVPTGYNRANYTLSVATYDTNVGKSTESLGVKADDGGKINLGAQAAADLPSTWTVAVIDLQSYITAGTWKSADSYLYFKFTQGNFSGNPGETEFDLAYFATVDTLEEMKALVGNDDVTYSFFSTGKFNATPQIKNVADNSCAIHTVPATVNTRTVATGTEYYYVCPACSQEFGSKIAPASVTNYKTAVYYADSAKTYFNKLPHSAKVEGSDVLANIKGVGSTAQIIFQRATADQSDAASAQQFTEDVKGAEWMVFKIRVSRTDLDARFVVSTEQYNGLPHIYIPVAAATEKEWAVYAVNLKTVLKDKYVADTNGYYIIDTFYNHIVGFLATDYFDVQYVAFVDGGWSDINALVKGEDVIHITAATDRTSYEIVNPADKTDAN